VCVCVCARARAHTRVGACVSSAACGWTRAPSVSSFGGNPGDPSFAHMFVEVLLDVFCVRIMSAYVLHCISLRKCSVNRDYSIAVCDCVIRLHNKPMRKRAGKLV
jgi:hypothetical protein